MQRQNTWYLWIIPSNPRIDFFFFFFFFFFTLIQAETDIDMWYSARLTYTHSRLGSPPTPRLWAVPAVLRARWTLFWVTWSWPGWHPQQGSICCGTVEAGQLCPSHMLLCVMSTKSVECCRADDCQSWAEEKFFHLFLELLTQSNIRNQYCWPDCKLLHLVRVDFHPIGLGSNFTACQHILQGW